MKEIGIRYATINDFTFIVDCQLKMSKETEGLELNRDTVTKGVQAVFDDPLKGFYIVGEETTNNELCSCLMITPEWSDWRNNNVWWIQSVFVLLEYREAGVFKKMYSFIKSMVTERQDIAGIRLYVDNTNQKAQNVYNRMGMTGEHYRVFEWMKV